MEKIIEMLQEKVGITKVQAEKVIELLKGVFGDSKSDLTALRSKATQKIEELEDEADGLADKASDTISDYVDKIRSMFGSTDTNDTTAKK